jgi:hypothetical protein
MLDSTNEAELVAYERAFYRAFGGNLNLAHLWNFDHKAKRISAKIAYEVQEIFLAKMGARIIAGAAINFGLDRTLQLEAEGFKVDKSKKDICEIVQMFCLVDPMGGTPLLKLFTKFFLEKLIARGIALVYGTCSQRRVRPYQMIGLEVVGELVRNDEMVFLLELDLKKNLPRLQGFGSFVG